MITRWMRIWVCLFVGLCVLPVFLQKVRTPRRQPYSALTFLLPKMQTQASSFTDPQYNGKDVRMINTRQNCFSLPWLFSLVAPGHSFSASEDAICYKVGMLRGQRGEGGSEDILWFFINVVHFIFIAHLLLKLFTGMVTLDLRPIGGIWGRTWRRGGAADDITRCHVTGI